MSTLAAPLASPFYEGSGVSAEVPSRWDCAINGIPFMFDTKYMDGRMRRSSVQLLKPQQDTASEFGERSLNPEDLIRQAVESWHHGAGQRFLDRPTSDPYRFRASKGVDVWTEARLGLLFDSELKRASAETTVLAVVAGDRLYLVKGSTVEWTSDLTNWTSVTGLPATAPNAVASDGFNVYLTCGADGVYVTNTGTSAASQLVTDAVANDAVIGFVKGRLMLGSDNDLYNITSTSAAALPTALFSHRTSSFRWKGFAAGQRAVYAIGFAGDKTDVYRTAVKTDGTGLEVPVHATPALPDGEVGRSIYGYGSVVTLGFENGWRLCVPDSDGNLQVGERVATSSPVLCFEGQDRFIWYGLTDYDDTSTGLGRLDPTALTAENALAPAYASDLMTAYGSTVQGAVTSAGTFLEKRFFTVAESGLWAEDADLVPLGTLDGGLITHGIPDPKVGIYLTLSHEPLVGTVAALVSADGGTFSSLGSSSLPDGLSTTLNVGQAKAETFEVRLELARSASAATAGPNPTRVTLESNPAPGRGKTFLVYLLLYDKVKDRNGTEVRLKPGTRDRYDSIVGMQDTGRLVTYQDAGGSQSVFVDDHDLFHDKVTATFFDGTLAVKLRRPRRRVT